MWKLVLDYIIGGGSNPKRNSARKLGEEQSYDRGISLNEASTAPVSLSQTSEQVGLILMGGFLGH